MHPCDTEWPPFACAMSSSPPAKMVVSSAHIATTVRLVSCFTWMWLMCMPLMVSLSMRDSGLIASAKRRGASGHPCPTPRSCLNGSDTDCEPMTHSVKPLAVDIGLCRPMPLWPMQKRTCSRYSWSTKLCGFCTVGHEEDGKSEGLNEGVDKHKLDDEVCGWDEWMVVNAVWSSTLSTTMQACECAQLCVCALGSVMCGRAIANGLWLVDDGDE